MRRFPATLLIATVLFSACTSSDAAGPTGTVTTELWTSTAPTVTVGATSMSVNVRVGRGATIAYSAYRTAQQLTAAQVRQDAAGTGGRSPAARGTLSIATAQAGTDVPLIVDSLTPNTQYFMYLAAQATQPTPAAPDTNTVQSVQGTLAVLQPATSYQSTAMATTIGYYAYRPESNYLDSTNRAPLMIFLHGSGEKGNGTTELSRVLVNGPPKLIAAGRALPFIIISPQLPANQGGWSNGLIDELIARAKANYRIDTTRIYVTGLSMGGYGTWAYATAKPTAVAAVVAIAGAGNPSAACNMKDVPVWAFHGDADGTVNVSGSINMVNAINACSPAAKVAPKLTIYPGVGHDSWSRTYDGSAGNDIYTWLLQYHR